jgi:hypothetical protein
MATFQIRRSRDYVPVEAIQYETSRGESTLEVSRERTQEDWGRCGEDQIVIRRLPLPSEKLTFDES